jgi:hypothetical protein
LNASQGSKFSLSVSPRVMDSSREESIFKLEFDRFKVSLFCCIPASDEFQDDNDGLDDLIRSRDAEKGFISGELLGTRLAGDDAGEKGFAGVIEDGESNAGDGK